MTVFLERSGGMSAAQSALPGARSSSRRLWWVSHQMPAATTDAYYSASNYASWNIVTSYAWPEKLSVLLMNATVSGLAFTEIWEHVFLLRQRCWLEQPRWCSYALDCGAPAASLLRQ